MPGRLRRFPELGELSAIAKWAGRGALSAALSLAFLSLAFFCVTGIASAEPPEVDLVSPANHAASSNREIKTEPEWTADQIEELVEQLGANRFAQRERASEQLLAIGQDSVAILTKWQEKTDDAEMLLRIGVIVNRLNEDNFDAKVKRFLAGNDAGMKNWPILGYIFGDTIRVREIYVELLREYPELVESLDGTPRDLALALQKVNARLDEKRIGLNNLPTRTDLLAALLPASDPKVPLEQSFESRLLSMLNMHPANDLRRDLALGIPFKGLVTLWAGRSGEFQRLEVLRLTMRWDLAVAKDLAIKTLDKKAEPELLATSFQAIAKYGKPGDATVLKPFLDDDRPLLKPLYVSNAVKTTISDAAIAAVAVMNDVQIVDLGFKHPAEHPIFAFIFDQLAYPPGDTESRAKAKASMLKLIEKPNGADAGGS